MMPMHEYCRGSHLLAGIVNQLLNDNVLQARLHLARVLVHRLLYVRPAMRRLGRSAAGSMHTQYQAGKGPGHLSLWRLW